MPRASRLRKGGSAKASRILFATGLSPATKYGSKVFGLSDLEVKTIQGMVLSCLNPVAAGRKRAFIFLFGDYPTCRGATGPILHWGRLVWAVATATNFCRQP
eukprot:5074854-Heterocapsa_arctica.AAC.1